MKTRSTRRFLGILLLLGVLGLSAEVFAGKKGAGEECKNSGECQRGLICKIDKNQHTGSGHTCQKK